MAKKRFFAVIDVYSDWAGNKGDMATWIDITHPGIDSTVYDSIADLVADNVLDALAETG
jgi:hypothetical protein